MQKWLQTLSLIILFFSDSSFVFSVLFKKKKKNLSNKFSNLFGLSLLHNSHFYGKFWFSLYFNERKLNVTLRNHFYSNKKIAQLPYLTNYISSKDRETHFDKRDETIEALSNQFFFKKFFIFNKILKSLFSQSYSCLYATHCF